MPGTSRSNNGSTEFRNKFRLYPKDNIPPTDHDNKDISNKNGRKVIKENRAYKHTSIDKRPPAPLPDITKRSIRLSESEELQLQEMNNPDQDYDADSGFGSEYSRSNSRTSSQNLDEIYSSPDITGQESSTSDIHPVNRFRSESNPDSIYSQPYEPFSRNHTDDSYLTPEHPIQESDDGYLQSVRHHSPHKYVTLTDNTEPDSKTSSYRSYNHSWEQKEQPLETSRSHSKKYNHFLDSVEPAPESLSCAPYEYSHLYSEIDESPYSSLYSEISDTGRSASCSPSQSIETNYLTPVSCAPYEYSHLYSEIDESPYSSLYSEISDTGRSASCSPSQSIETNYLTPVFEDKKRQRVYKKEKANPAPPEMSKTPQVAGHSENFVKLNNDLFAKSTTPDEAEVYEWRHQLKLNSIIPETVDAQTLGTSERQLLMPLLRRSEEQGSEVIIPKRLGARIPEHRKMEMDIKLGFETASVEQLSRSGHPHPHWKKAMHAVMDRLFKSKARGYRVEGYKKQGKPVDQNRLHLTKDSKQHIKQLINGCGIENRRKVLGTLNEIRAQLQQADITFIASSLLIVVDTEQPENTQVKLIDLAHPLYPGWTDYQKYKKDLLRGLDRLIDYAYRSIE